MWYIVLCLIALIYMLINLDLQNFIGSYIEFYIIQPLLWIGLAIVAYISAKKEEMNIWQFKKIRKWQIGKNPFQVALLIAGFQISLLVIAGLFFGFGKSPYAFTPPTILTNIIYITSLLFGLEFSRAYLIKKGITASKNATLTIGLVAFAFMVIRIPLSSLGMLNPDDPATYAQFIGENIIPLLAISLFASYLSYLGGALPAIGYMGTLQIFHWFSPILPNLPWTTTALIATIAPTIGFIIIQNSIQFIHSKKGRPRRRKTKDPALSWTSVAIISVFMVFFSFGYLGLQPVVIYSGSMQPELEVGDIILISNSPTDAIAIGDIVQYRSENITIVHRG